MLVTFGICFKKHFDTWYLVFYNTSPLSTWIFCKGVSGFATDCPCGVWCRGLTTCLLHVGPPFGNRILNNSWAVGLTLWIMNLICCVLIYAIIYVLIHQIIFRFYLLYFFKYSCNNIFHRRSLNTFYRQDLSQKSIEALNWYGQLLLDKDIAITIVSFTTILQSKQKVCCFVTLD